MSLLDDLFVLDEDHTYPPSYGVCGVFDPVMLMGSHVFGWWGGGGGGAVSFYDGQVGRLWICWPLCPLIWFLVWCWFFLLVRVLVMVPRLLMLWSVLSRWWYQPVLLHGWTCSCCLLCTFPLDRICRLQVFWLFSLVAHWCMFLLPSGLCLVLLCRSLFPEVLCGPLWCLCVPLWLRMFYGLRRFQWCLFRRCIVSLSFLS